MADRIGGIAAIAQQLLERLIALDNLILFEGEQKIEKGLGRNREAADGLLQGHHDRMARLAVITAEQLVAPPAQKS